MSDRRSRRPWRAAATLGVVLTATGCALPLGIDDDHDDGLGTLSATTLRSALIEPADVGHDFAIDTTRLPFYASCLSSLWRLPNVNQPRSQASLQVSPVPDHWPVVTEGIAEYPSAAAAKAVISQFEAELDGCNHVRFRNGDELAEADVRTDSARIEGSADHQLNVTVIGTTKYDGDPEHYDIGTWYSLIQVNNHLLVTGYTDMAVDEFGHMTELNRALLARVLTVAAGRPAPPMVPLDIEPTRFEDEPDGV